MVFFNTFNIVCVTMSNCRTDLFKSRLVIHYDHHEIIPKAHRRFWCHGFRDYTQFATVHMSDMKYNTAVACNKL